MKKPDAITTADLKSAFPHLTTVEAELALALMHREVTGNFLSSVEKWVSQCYNPPSKDERRLEALNQVLNGHGVEGITPDGEVYPKLSYVNMGDTYATTVLLDLTTDEFSLGCWGDWLEAWEAENLEDSEETEDVENE